MSGLKSTVDSRRGGWWRAPVSALLAVVGVLLVPLSLVARHVDTLGDTDRYVAIMTPLADDPVVQDAVIARVSAEVLSRIKVEDLTDQAVEALIGRSMPSVLAERLRLLSAPLEQAMTTYVEESVERLVRSEQFRATWEAANRAGHAQLLGLISGEGTTALQVDKGAVSVDLGAVIALARQEMVAQGFEPAGLIPEVSVELALFESPELVRMQRYARILDRCARWLPILSVVLLAGALVMSRQRRRLGVAIALGVMIASIITLTGLGYLREAALVAMGVQDQGIVAGGVVFDAIFGDLRSRLRIAVAVALGVAVLLWLVPRSTAAWPSRPARQP